MAFRSQDDSGRDASEEPAGAEQSHERVGQRKGQDGTAREKDHTGNQEECQAGPDGRCKSHGQGENKITFSSFSLQKSQEIDKIRVFVTTYRILAQFYASFP